MTKDHSKLSLNENIKELTEFRQNKDCLGYYFLGDVLGCLSIVCGFLKLLGRDVTSFRAWRLTVYMAIT